MKTLHPTTTLTDTPQPSPAQLSDFPQVHSFITEDCIQAILANPTENRVDRHKWLIGHARRAWVNLGGGQIMGWSFTVDGTNFYAEFHETFKDITRMTLDLRR